MNDIDINQMFKTKNKEIFINSLTLEMERNLEALKNTTDNCVALEINKLFIFFKEYFDEIKLPYKKEEILGLLYRERKRINDIVNTKIEEKKQNIKANFLEKEIEEDIISEEYLDKYYEELKKETEIINDKLELELNEEICVEFSPKLAAKYKLDSTEQLERINSRINVLFKNNIISKVKSQTEFRDESLKNMFTESYNKYLELNKNTVEEK